MDYKDEVRAHMKDLRLQQRSTLLWGVALGVWICVAVVAVGVVIAIIIGS